MLAGHGFLSGRYGFIWGGYGFIIGGYGFISGESGFISDGFEGWPIKYTGVFYTLAHLAHPGAAGGSRPEEKTTKN